MSFLTLAAVILILINAVSSHELTGHVFVIGRPKKGPRSDQEHKVHFDVQDQDTCQAMCSKREGCQSVNFYVHTKECIVNFMRKKDDADMKGKKAKCSSPVSPTVSKRKTSTISSNGTRTTDSSMKARHDNQSGSTETNQQNGPTDVTGVKKESQMTENSTPLAIERVDTEKSEMPTDEQAGNKMMTSLALNNDDRHGASSVAITTNKQFLVPETSDSLSMAATDMEKTNKQTRSRLTTGLTVTSNGEQKETTDAGPNEQLQMMKTSSLLTKKASMGNRMTTGNAVSCSEAETTEVKVEPKTTSDGPDVTAGRTKEKADYMTTTDEQASMRNRMTMENAVSSSEAETTEVKVEFKTTSDGPDVTAGRTKEKADYMTTIDEQASMRNRMTMENAVSSSEAETTEVKVEFKTTSDGPDVTAGRTKEKADYMTTTDEQASMRNRMTMENAVSSSEAETTEVKVEPKTTSDGPDVTAGRTKEKADYMTTTDEQSSMGNRMTMENAVSSSEAETTEVKVEPKTTSDGPDVTAGRTKEKADYMTTTDEQSSMGNRMTMENAVSSSEAETIEVKVESKTTSDGPDVTAGRTREKADYMTTTDEQASMGNRMTMENAVSSSEAETTEVKVEPKTTSDGPDVTAGRTKEKADYMTTTDEQASMGNRMTMENAVSSSEAETTEVKVEPKTTSDGPDVTAGRTKEKADYMTTTDEQSSMGNRMTMENAVSSSEAETTKVKVEPKTTSDGPDVTAGRTKEKADYMTTIDEQSSMGNRMTMENAVSSSEAETTEVKVESKTTSDGPDVTAGRTKEKADYMTTIDEQASMGNRMTMENAVSSSETELKESKTTRDGMDVIAESTKQKEESKTTGNEQTESTEQETEHKTTSATNTPSYGPEISEQWPETMNVAVNSEPDVATMESFHNNREPTTTLTTYGTEAISEGRETSRTMTDIMVSNSAHSEITTKPVPIEKSTRKEQESQCETEMTKPKTSESIIKYLGMRNIFSKNYLTRFWHHNMALQRGKREEHLFNITMGLTGQPGTVSFSISSDEQSVTWLTGRAGEERLMSMESEPDPATATFFVKEAYFEADTISFQCACHPDYFIRHHLWKLKIDSICPQPTPTHRKDASWIIT